MYKAGKTWVVAPLVLLGMVAGIHSNDNSVKADQISQTSQKTVQLEQKKDTKKANQVADTKDNTPEKAPLESKAEQTKGESDTKQSANNVTDPVEQKKDLEKIESSENAISNRASPEKNNDVNEDDTDNAQQSNVNDLQNKEESSGQSIQHQTLQNNDVTKKNDQEQNNDPSRLMKKGVSQNGPAPKEVKRDGYWYLVDQNGNNLTGFNRIPEGDKQKTVYYDNSGKMLYGQQFIQNYWYHFDEIHGTMSTGLTYLKDDKKTVFYDEQGRMRYGLQNVNGRKYLFDTPTGAMHRGSAQYQGNTYFFNNNGQMFTGERKMDGHWYYFDKNTGKKATGFAEVSAGNNVKKVYYNQQGQMQYGQQKVNGYWYHFNETTGEMSRGLTYLKDDRKTVFYNNDGHMQYGLQNLASHKYLFDEKTGAMQKGLLHYRNNLYFFQNDGKMFTGQKKINGGWYYFDQQTGQAARGFTNVPEGAAVKTVYYDQNGRMRYGQQSISRHWYHFDENTGEMSTGFVRLKDLKKTVYYDANGQMLYGQQSINGHKFMFSTPEGAMQTGFFFDQNLGVLKYYNKNGQMNISNVQADNGTRYEVDRQTGAILGVGEVNFNKKTYLFKNGGNGQIITGFVTRGNNTVYYLASSGTKVYGQEKINDAWYLFDLENGAMKHGFQNVPGQNKVAYYDGQGKMVHGEMHYQGHWYYFDDKTGAMAKGLTKLNNKTTFYDNNGWMIYGEHKVNGSWHHFDEITGAMSVGFTYLKNGNKTVYYNSNGSMLYGWQVIGEHQYYLKLDTGARSTGTINISGVNYRFGSNGVFQGFTQRVLNWFNNHRGKLTYSMLGSRNGSDGTADCSGAMTQALWSAGAGKPAASVSRWGGYNTESIHGYLNNNGYHLVAQGTAKYTPRYGDIVIWGKLGASAGAGGHIQVISTGGSDPHGVSVNAHEQDRNGKNAKNQAVQDYSYSWYWNDHNRPYSYIYRPNNIHRS